MTLARVYADFQNADAQGRVRLNCSGTLHDLARQHVVLRDGLSLTLYADDATGDGRPDELHVSAVVEYSREESCWVAVIDWDAIRHASEKNPETHNGAAPGRADPMPDEQSGRAV